MKQLFVFFIITFYSTFTIAQTTFAGIEIGSKGVKFTVLTFNKGQNGRVWFFSEMEKTKNTDVISGSASAIAETAAAVKNFSDTAQRKFNIPTHRIIIVISSGAMQELNKKEKTKDLATAIRNELATPNQTIYFVTPEQEGKFTAISLIPRKELDRAVVIDIGSGNTKGGYFADNSYKNFEAITFPLGTKTLTKEIKALNPENFNDFVDKTEKHIKNKVKKDFMEEIERKPAVLNRNMVYLSGGIVWAVNSVMHPENAKEEYSTLTLKDVEAFKKKLVKDYDKMFEIDTKKMTADVSAEAHKNITNVKNTFDKESLLAGSLLLQTTMKALEQQSDKKEYQFYKYSSWSWLTSVVLLEFFDQIK